MRAASAAKKSGKQSRTIIQRTYRLGSEARDVSELVGLVRRPDRYDRGMAETKFKKGTRVVATDTLRGVPEGTPGNVRIAVGLTWLRYRVTFDNGVDIGSVGHNRLVEERSWPEFKSNRERLAVEAADRATETAAAAAAAPKPEPAASAETASDPAADKLAALMARSKAARETQGS